MIKNQCFGIEVIGEDARVIVKRSKIKFNNKAGLCFGVGVNGYCIRNDIAYNGNGVLLISA